MPARILIVDDDLTALLPMQAALQKAGFAVCTAVDGDEALRQFRAQRCDLVMLDVEMPGKSGYEVCGALRAEAGDLMPIVMVTGRDDVRSVERAYDAGATDFIAKPINWALIGHRVRYLLRGYQSALQLQAADARNAAVLKAIPDLLFEVDQDGRFVDYHSPHSDLLPGKGDRFIGRTVSEVLPPEAARICMIALRQADESGLSTGLQYEVQLAQRTCWFELSVSRKMGAAGRQRHFIALARDITERKEAERRILRLAFFDSLTGLPNRQSFLERVDREIQRARQGGYRLGVLFMDFDGFKNINDTMGHSAGDLILQWAADRLSDGLRPTDALARAGDIGSAPETTDDADAQIARLGGDEFTALISNLVRPDDALAVAHRILQLMRRPFTLDGRDVTLTTSIGIAIYPEDGEDALTLLKHADTAMYHAKDSGCDNCQFYNVSLTQQAVQRMNLENDLRAALKRDEFMLHYQPQLDLAEGRVLSVEALIRWNHPERGLIGPMEFIPLAEENGLIVPIGEWVLRAACADGAAWLRAGQPVRVAVNLSPMQFRDPNLVRTVLEVLEKSGLAPHLLELEITEGAVMEHSSAILAILRALRDAGVNVALDDFGTGYSSMSYLKRMPLSHLKVDRSFVKGLPEDLENFAIVRAVLSLAKSLGLSVTAEGVETLAQAQALKELACNAVQGYYFSRPVPAAQIPALLAKRWSIGAPLRVAGSR